MRAIKKTAMVLTALMLAACQTDQPNMVFEKPDFSKKTPITFEAGDLIIEDNYQPANAAPNVDHQFPTPPLEAVHAWANQRLRTTAGTNKLVLAIEDASVVEMDIAKEHIGWKDGFYVEPAKEYRGTLKGTLKLYAANSNLPKAEAEATVTVKETAQENASLYDRKKIYNDMMLSMVYRFDAEMDRQTNQYFKNYRVYK